MLIRVIGFSAAVFGLAAWGPAIPPESGDRSDEFVAEMNGAQEVPANNGKGTGRASLEFDGTKLEFSVEVKDLTGPATAAHIHAGGSGENGPPVYTFELKDAGTSGKIAEGTIDLTKDASEGVGGDSLKALISNGKAYVNVHTGNFPNGEVRGQVIGKS